MRFEALGQGAWKSDVLKVPCRGDSFPTRAGKQIPRGAVATMRPRESVVIERGAMLGRCWLRNPQMRKPTSRMLKRSARHARASDLLMIFKVVAFHIVHLFALYCFTISA